MSPSPDPPSYDTNYDSGPMPLDSKHRRAMDRRIQEWANSNVLKLSQYVITTIAIPFVTWVLWQAGERLSKIEAAITAQTVQNAQNEYRFAALERQAAEILRLDGQQRRLVEQNLEQQYEIQRLKELAQRR